MLEIFLIFLRLGLTSFGGPIAHLGYFRQEFVVKRQWLDDAAYGDLVALCQFLPGPASSQVGFALGVRRSGGLAGGIAAWLGFTAPSALVMVLAAIGWASLPTVWEHTGLQQAVQGLIQGLKLVAVAVVAQALWGMRISLTPDRPRQALALVAFAVLTLIHHPLAQILTLVGGALAGLIWCRQTEPSPASPTSAGSRSGLGALILFAMLLVGLPWLAEAGIGWRIFDHFYRAGALVFGGGHVVLPLLQAELVEGPDALISLDGFLAGYGAAQAVPGPLFTLAAYLGVLATPGHWIGAPLALIAVFLPGLLLVYGCLPFWHRLRALPLAQAGLRGANAAVVGILGAAFYAPILTSALTNAVAMAVALAATMALVVWRVSPWIIVVALAGLGMAGLL